MNARTIAELELKRAQLVAKAEALRAAQRAAVLTSPRAAALGRQVRDIQEQADDYARILAFAKAPAATTKELRKAS